MLVNTIFGCVDQEGLSSLLGPAIDVGQKNTVGHPAGPQLTCHFHGDRLGDTNGQLIGAMMPLQTLLVTCLTFKAARGNPGGEQLKP